ncbi:hypothetical protein [Listeria booriae]|uniref:hypothetical protein n=1 Tax=Listeria booriae TaxID=1552123 RepID=UPI00162354B8|nr:hypothetical protein [Listeria booriae]MBC2303408.1 hypothetical protein [Listeria booriae]
MKTSEFKAILNELNLKYYERNGEWVAHDETYYDLISVSVDCQFAMKITKHAYEVLNAEQVAELYELVTAYASTPISEREEPKKWYLRDPVTQRYLFINEQYCDDIYEKRMWGRGMFSNRNWKNKFTRAEIDAFEFEHAHLIEDEVTR